MGTLSDIKVRKLKNPGKHSDGGGLTLLVAPSGAKSWVQRVTINGKRHDLGLGSYPAVTLAEARRKALANRALVMAGGNPLAVKRQETAEATMPTFEDLARQHIAENSPAWRNSKHRAQWLSTLETYAFPAIGSVRVNEISRKQVINTLSPIWHTKPETARRVRQRIRAVMDRAVALEYIDSNPAADAIITVLGKTSRIRAHHRSAPYGELPAVIQAIRECTASPSVKLAFELLALTACRSGEVRGMTWAEFDWEKETWTIPAERMKAGKEHRVPLSRRAMAILREAQSLSDSNGLVFPAPRSGGNLSDMAFTQMLRRLELDFVPHGLRSSFRDWAAEQTDAPHAVMERALAHVVSNATEAAYARSDLFDRRRGLMEKWGDFLKGDAGK